MRTLGRVLIILIAFAIIMGITYVAVNASSSSSSTSVLASERGGEGLSRPAGVRPESGGAGPRSGGWMAGLLKNTGIVASIVALITIPKNLKRKKAIPVTIA